jgi:hypothetical protein
MSIDPQPDEVIIPGQSVSQAQMLALLTDLVATIEAFQSVTTVVYVSEAVLLADLTPAAGTLAFAADTLKAHVKSGSSGTGSWTLSANALSALQASIGTDDAAGDLFGRMSAMEARLTPIAAAVSGTSDDIVLTPAAGAGSVVLADGLAFAFTPVAPNTGAVTIAAAGNDPAPLVLDDAAAALAAGVLGSAPVLAVWNDAAEHFRLVGGAVSVSERDIRQVLETVTGIVPTLPATPIIDLRGSDMLSDQKALANRRAATAIPTNIITQSTGQMRGLGGTETDFHATGPSGGTTARRVQIGAGTGIHDIINGPQLPAGTYTLACRLKSTAGAGAQTVQFGTFNTDLSVVNLDESTWVKPTHTFTLATASSPRLCVFNNGADADFLIDEMQLHEGSSVPDFETDFDGHLSPELRLPNALPSSGDAVDASAGLKALVPLASYPAETTFSAGTILAVISTEDTAVIAAKVLATAGNGGAFDVGVANGRAYAMPAYTRTDPGDELKIAGRGYHILASRFSASEQAFFFDGIKYVSEAGTLGNQVVRSLAAFGDPDIPGSTFGNFPFKGLFSAGVVYDRALTDAEMVTAVRSLRAAHDVHREAAVVSAPFWIATGDSITADGDSYFHQFFDGGAAPWFGKNEAVSGSPITYDRWSHVEEQITTALEHGHTPVVSLLFGANHTLDSAAFAAFQARWATLRALGAKTVVCTVLPRDVTGWEASRTSFNADIIAASAEYDALADIGADPFIGDAAAPAAGVYYYDATHLNAAGHEKALDVISPVLASVI